MCTVCIATGRMTGAEWDQIQAAERDQNLAALIDICGKISDREDAKRASAAAPAPVSSEDVQEDDTLDRILTTLIDLAGKYDHLPLRQANQALAKEIVGAGSEQLAHGMAALATRLWRNSR